MRHLRKFNEKFSTDDYYHKIDNSAGVVYCFDDRIYMEKRWVKMLKKMGFRPTHKSGLVFSMEKMIFKGLGDRLKYNILSFASFGSYQDGIELFVSQLEDEYFVVQETEHYKSQYFLCDQFDGLIRLLKDKGWDK